MLNRSKLRTSEGATWTRERVATFRTQHRIAEFNQNAKEQSGWMTQAEAAILLDISPMSVTRLVQIGIIPAEQPQPGLPAVIKRDDLCLERVQRDAALLKTRPIVRYPRTPIN